MPKVIGIDLGTTNTLGAYMEAGQPVVIPSAEGDELVPSIVGFTKTGERLVGAMAKRQAVSNPERTVISIKRHMGTDYKVKIDDKELTPQEISAFILQKIKADAEAYLGEPIEKAVVTVPAYFNDAERQATKDAGTIAGLDVIRIINEPTASCMSYGLDKMDQSETILVWDLGGGTFDVSILEIGGGVFEVRATSGDMRLGGDDWDQRIMDYLVDEFRKNSNIDLKTDREAMQRLKEASEEAKISLSTNETTKINLPFIAADATGPKHLEIELSRKKFEELTRDLVERCELPASQALKDSDVGKMQIDKILLVGGSTRMPMIREKVRKVFGKEPSTEIDPDKVVAMGAAIQGGVLNQEVKEVVLLDVTSLTLGIETTGGVFTSVIPRNTQIPCEKSRMFTTAVDGQTIVEVHILQGEREVAKHNKSLGRFELRNIPPAPRGVPQIEVTFAIDVNGIVNVSAKDLATGQKQKITIQTTTNLTPEEIQRMLKEAAVYQVEDTGRTKEATIRVTAQAEIDMAEKTIREHGARLDVNVLRKIRHNVDELKQIIETYNYDRAPAAIDKLKRLIYDSSAGLYVEAEAEREREKEREKAKAAPSKADDIEDRDDDEEVLDWFTK